jgi:hypothetical protein
MKLDMLEAWMFLAAAVIGAIYLLMPLRRAGRDDR